jgi:ribosomal protein S18 acetylase RimI-like enzyme
MSVHDDFRRRGIGSALMAAPSMLPTIGLI